ncbi:MAG: restriction endonuclease [Actinobacteria bacterium]|uniref:site-specific DNA-methyltransferase (adenine-specific) n=1 Tax=freshwater metagenome TaxID=449393 RepID=A0A6J7LNZ0_9ZZZZ|nr:restriction endonuclease [Actinomycetota bacterium]
MTDAVALTRQQRVPDILDVIAALSSDAVPTPPLLARALLDVLPVEVWSNPDYKWLDPATKSGSILREAARRLMDGLAGWEPDPVKRADHILRNMLYGCAITQVHGEMTRRSVYVSRDATSPMSLVKFATPAGNLPFTAAEHDYALSKDGQASGPCRVCGAPVRLERGDSRENYAYAFIHGAYPTEEMKDMQFDVIVGNPPYQTGDKKNEDDRSSPIYQHFIEHAIALNPKYLAMIVPSRWFTGGFGLDKFRERMISDRHFRSIVDNPKVFDCFPGVEIMGGVNYFLWDRDHDGDCEFSTRINGSIFSTTVRDLRDGDGIVLRDNRASTIVEKIKVRHAGIWCDTVCGPQMAFGSMRTNFSGDHPVYAPGDIALVFSNRVGYVAPEAIEKNRPWVEKWKVLLPKAYNGGQQVDAAGVVCVTVIGEPIALAPGSACTQTYLVAGLFDTAEETENYAHYLATKFARFLVLQRKTTQDIYSDRFKFVPYLDMKRRWSDRDLYVHFRLTKDEVAYIEAGIRPRSVNLSLDSPVPSSHLPGGAKYRAPGTSEELDLDEDDE